MDLYTTAPCLTDHSAGSMCEQMQRSLADRTCKLPTSVPHAVNNTLMAVACLNHT